MLNPASRGSCWVEKVNVKYRDLKYSRRCEGSSTDQCGTPRSERQFPPGDEVDLGEASEGKGGLPIAQ